MEVVQIILGILVIIVSIIIIVKFFQIVSDVREIKEHLKNGENIPDTKSTNDSVGEFKTGSTIVEKKTEKQMRIIDIDKNTGKFICSNNSGFTTVYLNADEILLFDDYVKTLKK